MSELHKMTEQIGEKGRFNYRQFFMVCVLVFITSAEVLFDYITAGFSAQIFYDASYWVRLAITCLSIILVTLTVRDFFRERELNQNPSIKKVQCDLDAAHAELTRRDLMTRLEAYIADTNSARKVKAYKAYLQFKLFRAKDKRKAKWVKLLETAETDAPYLPVIGKKMQLSWNKWVRYNRVSITTVFARSGKSKSDDEDLDSNEGSAIGEMLFKKLLPLVAFSVAISTLFFDNGTFAVEILINTFAKLFRIAMSMYTGAMSGQDFVKVTLMSKMERRLEFIQKFLERERQTKKAEPTETVRE